MNTADRPERLPKAIRVKNTPFKQYNLLNRKKWQKRIIARDLSFALYSLLLEFAARELLIGRRQERIIWLADAAADIKTERCDWLRVEQGERWLAID